MSIPKRTYDTYCEILKEELKLAMGCTEPIAIAYAAAVARNQLHEIPSKITVGLSGNIIKNTKSVVVPGTGGLHGIVAAVVAGTIANRPDLILEVLSVLSEEDIPNMKALMSSCDIQVEELNTSHIFEVFLVMQNENEEVKVRLLDRHTNLVFIEKNGQTVLKKDLSTELDGVETDRSLLNVEDIVRFVDEVNLEDVRELLERQIACNMAIAEEGLKGNYGACIGKTIYKNGNCSLAEKAKAYAAAGSDARMNGCELPVCIISGSGNQGMTASIPIVVFARELGCSKEKMLRALLLSDLVTVHLKTGIGCLSAYCGAVSAGCGCGAGITYLQGGEFKDIAHTIVNAVAILSGTICDGAKSSCAAKIAMAVESGILGYEMYKNGNQFYGGEGIVSKGVENTIKNVGKLASEGMQGTDKEIIKIMLK